MRVFCMFCILFLLPSCSSKVQEETSKIPQIPHLKKQGQTTQLIVEDQPFIVLGGELGNSSFTSLEYMSPIWEQLKTMNLNTVLVPIYWELIEKEEGVFDFELMDELVAEARKHDLKLVILWFASWKNSMSSHIPAWVKQNQERFPRAKDEKGINQEILTPFSEHNLAADLKAFEALMQHIKEIDEQEHTIIMVQPENEIAMLPSARDYHPFANEKFHADVPKELMDYLVQNKDNLVPEFEQVWAEYGYKTSGTWEQVFGKSLQTDERFMAYHFSKYTNAITAAGKAIYPLPMFVNAALPRPGKEPGKGYPSAGPLPHLMDFWKAGGDAIDFFSPDFYNPDFKKWNDLYTRQGNPLFIPEHRFDNTVAVKAAFAIGHYEGIGFAPFSIESTDKPEEEGLGKMYHLLDQLSPLISKYQGQGNIDGVLLDKENPESIVHLGDYELSFRHSHLLGWEAASKNETWENAGAIIIQTADQEFYVAGTGFTITFKNLKKANQITGILKTEEGYFEKDKWIILRHLNGDQTHQGRHIRVFLKEYAIQRFELYDY